MEIKIIKTTPFLDQKPGTSGLRKKTSVFMRLNYTENFIESVFQALSDGSDGFFRNKTLVIGGDGRFYNRQAAQIIIKMAVAHGFSKILVAKDALCSTPAVSAIIRTQKAFGGFVLSASHNPGGINEDFGIKYNITNGGPAPEGITERIFSISKELKQYKIANIPDIPLDVLGHHTIEATEVVIVNPLSDYTNIMQQLFDFDLLSSLFRSGFKLRFDAMHAVTGIYAHHIFEEILSAPKGTVLNGIAKEDFAKGHPDPNQVHAHELIELLNSDATISLGAASDGDGDRNMIIGHNFFVSPGDSLSIITEYSKFIPGYKDGLLGVARSMPTSTAVDRVAKSLNIKCYETPTGWKFFGNLMDAGLCTICGEESFGTGSNHVREKDGLWAVLCWLSILANTNVSVEEITKSHWKKFGRCCFQRHDYEKLDSSKAADMMFEIRASLDSLNGVLFGDSKIISVDDFSYIDPVDLSTSDKQGIRIFCENGDRVVFRLSGTGTSGATLRIYLESYRSDAPSDYAGLLLSPLISSTRKLLKLKERFGAEEPSVIT